MSILIVVMPLGSRCLLSAALTVTQCNDFNMQLIMKVNKCDTQQSNAIIQYALYVNDDHMHCTGLD